MSNHVAPWIREARIASWWLTKNDFYWPDYEVEEEIVRRAAEYGSAGVNTVVIFGLHFRWDYVPYFGRLHLLFQRIVKECHKHGIRVCDHYSDTLTHRPQTEEDRWFIRERLNHHVAIYPDCDYDYTYAGSARNSWRQVDARTGEPAYYIWYRCNMFCPNNPDYQRASAAYALSQFEAAGIDGMMNDDLEFLPDPYHSCACEHCRKRFREECGRDLPPADNQEFWGNRRNPAFRDWLAMRCRSTGDHYVRLRKALGPQRPLFGCCSSMDGQWSSDLACVHDEFSRGLNVVSMEMMPRNPVIEWGPLFARQSIYQAVAAAGDFLRGETPSIMEVTRPDPFIGLTYNRAPEQSFMSWAMVSAWGARSWTCKDTASDNPKTARAVYDDRSHLARTVGWQAKHESLYADAARVADVAIAFSPATRTLCSPEEADGHRRQLICWGRLMVENGILSETLLAQGLRGAEAGRLLAAKRALLILPRVAALADAEFEGISSYLDAGGNVIVSGELGCYTESGADKTPPFLEKLALRKTSSRGKIVCVPHTVIEQAIPAPPKTGEIFHESADRQGAIKACLQTLRRYIANPSIQPGEGTEGWTFHLYARDGALLLHFLNLSGTIPAEGRPVPDDEAVTYPIPRNGIVECRVRMTDSVVYGAKLYSPDGAEGMVVPMDVEASCLRLKIPVQNARHYGIVLLTKE